MVAAEDVFAVPVFFICFRESLETAIIISVLLAFLKQTLGSTADKAVHKKLVKQVWWGVAAGLAICLVIGGAFIGVFYSLGANHFSLTEDVWEGAFGLVAAIIITLMGAALLRVSKLQDKWRVKIAQAVEKKENRHTAGTRRGAFKQWCERYAMFILPFVTVLREGLEAVVFIGGVGLSLPATSFPLAVFCGFLCGIFVGWLIYKGGNTAKLQLFLIVSTCFLYLVAAGLFSKAVWNFEANAWNQILGADADDDFGDGAGSYDIRKSVWHVNCCNPEDTSTGGGGWGIFNAILGWENSATYGSVISYNLYWLAVIITFVTMRYQEQHGHLPFMKAKAGVKDVSADDNSGSNIDAVVVNKKAVGDEPVASTAVREIVE